MTDINGTKCDIAILLGLSSGGYGLFSLYGKDVTCLIVGALILFLGVYGHVNTKVPKESGK